MKYTRLFADAHGESHFEEVAVPMTSVDFAPPAPPMDLSDFSTVSLIGFLRAPAGFVGDWHPAPKRQWMLYLAGSIEAEVSDGARRVFGPGSVTLVEDTSGRGHKSRVVGDDAVLLAVVQVDESGNAG